MKSDVLVIMHIVFSICKLMKRKIDTGCVCDYTHPICLNTFKILMFVQLLLQGQVVLFQTTCLYMDIYYGLNSYFLYMEDACKVVHIIITWIIIMQCTIIIEHLPIQ